MSLLAIDQIEACPIVSDVSDTVIRNYLRGVASRIGAGNGKFKISSGELSDRMLDAGPISGFNRGYFGIPQTQNSAAIHVLGAAVRITSATLDKRPLVAINAAVDSSLFQDTLMIYILADGTISVGSSVSAAGLIPLNTFVYLEAVLDPSDGSVDVYVNDALAVSGTLSFSQIDTFVFMIQTVSGSASYGMQIDNYYFLDNVNNGDGYTSRLGPISVKRLPLSTEESVTFTPVNAADNITAVNKTSLADTSYVRSPQADDQADLYSVDTTAIDDAVDILGIVAAPYFRKTELGARSLAAIATDGSNTLSKTFTDADTTFRGSSTPLVMDKAPDGTAWTKAKVAACEFGYKVLA